MSNFKTHLIVGSLVIAILSTILYFTTNLIILDSKTLLMLVMIAYIFPLLPDLDTRASTIVWSFLGIGIFGISITILNNYYHIINNGTPIMIMSCLLLIGTFIGPFTGHRRFIHSISFGVIASTSLYFIVPSIGLCIIAMVAFYSHLVCDKLYFKLI